MVSRRKSTKVPIRNVPNSKNCGLHHCNSWWYPITHYKLLRVLTAADVVDVIRDSHESIVIGEEYEYRRYVYCFKTGKRMVLLYVRRVWEIHSIDGLMLHRTSDANELLRDMLQILGLLPNVRPHDTIKLTRHNLLHLAELLSGTSGHICVDVVSHKLLLVGSAKHCAVSVFDIQDTDDPNVVIASTPSWLFERTLTAAGVVLCET